MKRLKKLLRIVFFLLVVLVAGLAVAWYTGAFSQLVVSSVDQRLLPYRTGKEFMVTGMAWDSEPAKPLTDGVRLSISQERLTSVLADAGVRSWWLPPGLIRDGLTVTGTWFPYPRGQSAGIEIPVEFRVDYTEGDHPHLAGRLPVSKLNAYMDIEFAEDYVSEREEYILGHYDYAFYPTILSGSIRTMASPDLPPDAFVEQLTLEAKARGTVKLKFRENLFKTSTDATIPELHLLLAVTNRVDEAGVILDYDAKMIKLRGNVRKLHSAGDKRVSEKLRKKWERSLNKEKRRRKLARHPLPDWAPLDWVVDLAFLPEPPKKENP